MATRVQVRLDALTETKIVDMPVDSVVAHLMDVLGRGFLMPKSKAIAFVREMPFATETGADYVRVDFDGGKVCAGRFGADRIFTI